MSEGEDFEVGASNGGGEGGGEFDTVEQPGGKLEWLQGSPISHYYHWMTDFWFFLKMPWTGMLLYTALTFQIFNFFTVLIAGLVVKYYKQIWWAWMDFVEQQAEAAPNQQYDYEFDEEDRPSPWD